MPDYFRIHHAPMQASGGQTFAAAATNPITKIMNGSFLYQSVPYLLKADSGYPCRVDVVSADGENTPVSFTTIPFNALLGLKLELSLTDDITGDVTIYIRSLADGGPAGLVFKLKFSGMVLTYIGTASPLYEGGDFHFGSHGTTVWLKHCLIAKIDDWTTRYYPQSAVMRDNDIHFATGLLTTEATQPVVAHPSLIPPNAEIPWATMPEYPTPAQLESYIVTGYRHGGNDFTLRASGRVYCNNSAIFDIRQGSYRSASNGSNLGLQDRTATAGSFQGQPYLEFDTTAGATFVDAIGGWACVGNRVIINFAWSGGDSDLDTVVLGVQYAAGRVRVVIANTHPYYGSLDGTFQGFDPPPVPYINAVTVYKGLGLPARQVCGAYENGPFLACRFTVCAGTLYLMTTHRPPTLAGGWPLNPTSLYHVTAGGVSHIVNVPNIEAWMLSTASDDPFEQIHWLSYNHRTNELKRHLFWMPMAPSGPVDWYSDGGVTIPHDPSQRSFFWFGCFHAQMNSGRAIYTLSIDYDGESGISTVTLLAYAPVDGVYALNLRCRTEPGGALKTATLAPGQYHVIRATPTGWQTKYTHMYRVDFPLAVGYAEYVADASAFVGLGAVTVAGPGDMRVDPCRMRGHGKHGRGGFGALESGPATTA